MLIKSLTVAAFAAVTISAFTASAFAQTAPAAVTQGAANIKRTPLQKVDVAGTNLEAVTALAEIVPSVMIGKHSHPGTESSYLVDGEIVLMVTGQPERTLKAGDSFQIAAGVPHDGKTGPKGAKIVVTYIVEKGKPLATPVP